MPSRAGMMDLKGAHEWVVTTKLGSSDVRPGTTPTVTRNCRMYAGEMAMSGFVLGAAFYGVFTVNRWTFSIFLFLQVRTSGEKSSINQGSSACRWTRPCCGGRCYRQPVDAVLALSPLLMPRVLLAVSWGIYIRGGPRRDSAC